MKESYLKSYFSGYVLDDFLSTSEGFLSINDQFEFIKKLPLTPDYIINLRVRILELHRLPFSNIAT